MAQTRCSISIGGLLRDEFLWPFAGDKALSLANGAPSEVGSVHTCITLFRAPKLLTSDTSLEPHDKPVRKLGIIISILETIKRRPGNKKCDPGLVLGGARICKPPDPVLAGRPIRFLAAGIVTSPVAEAVLRWARKCVW